MNTIIDYSVEQVTDQFDATGFDADGWAKNDRAAKAANMISHLDACDLSTASIRAIDYRREIGDWQTVCDIIRASLFARHVQSLGGAK